MHLTARLDEVAPFALTVRLAGYFGDLGRD